jgi:hypothetical protein
MHASPTILSLWAADLRRLGLQCALGLGLGLCAALALCLLAGLYPWYEDQHPALALIGLTFSLPLGAVSGATAKPPRHALARAVFAGLGLGCALAATSGYFIESTSWFCAAALLGAALSALMPRAGGVGASALWLLLCALPFFYERLAQTPLGGVSFTWASGGCPWLGFARDVFEVDPLRLSVLYLGQWSALSGIQTPEYLAARELWLLAALAMGAVLALKAWRGAPRTA